MIVIGLGIGGFFVWKNFLATDDYLLESSEGNCDTSSQCEYAGEGCGGGHGICTNEPNKYKGFLTTCDFVEQHPINNGYKCECIEAINKCGWSKIGYIENLDLLPPEIKKDETADWKIYRDKEMNIEFSYPQQLNKNYIKLTPPLPKISLKSIDSNFECDEELISKKGLYFGNVREAIVNENNYCIIEVSEGAMGHIYKTYYYIVDKHDKQITLQFVLSYSNCGALYGIDNKMQECEQEQSEFDSYLLGDQIFSTFKFLE